MPKPVPFRLDRAISANLADQLADGLRSAIVSGYYRKGDVLPTIVELARTLGTSVQVPRTAIAALSAENLVNPRRAVRPSGVPAAPWRCSTSGFTPTRSR